MRGQAELLYIFVAAAPQSPGTMQLSRYKEVSASIESSSHIRHYGKRLR